MSTTTTTPLDAARLLQFAIRAEAEASRGGQRVDHDDDDEDATTAALFGHPESPSLHLYALRNNQQQPQHSRRGSSTAARETNAADVVVLLLLAHTRHTVSAQLLVPTATTSSSSEAAADRKPAQQQQQPKQSKKDRSDPVAICSLFPEDDGGGTAVHERITCLTVVSLHSPNGNSSGGGSSSYHNNNNNYNSMDAAASSSSISRRSTVEDSSNNSMSNSSVASSSTAGAGAASITSTSSLMRGVVHINHTTSSGSAAKNSQKQQSSTHEVVERVAVLFGTDASRVYAVEVAVSRGDGGGDDNASDGNGNNSKNTSWSLRPMALRDAADRDTSTLFQVFPRGGDDPAAARRSSSLWRSKTRNDRNNNNDNAAVSFHPAGGVSRLSNYYRTSPDRTATTTIVWIGYGDGTLVRLHGAACFPSLWQRAARNNASVEDYLLLQQQQKFATSSTKQRTCVRCKVRWSDDRSSEEDTTAFVVPLPRQTPSPLAPLLTTGGAPGKVRNAEDVFEAIVFSTAPAFCFYTSEGVSSSLTALNDESEHSSRRRPASRKSSGSVHSGQNYYHHSNKSSLDGSSDHALRSVTKSLVGSAMGALRWGLVGSPSSGGGGGARPDSYDGRSLVSGGDDSRMDSSLLDNDNDNNSRGEHSDDEGGIDQEEEEPPEPDGPLTPFPSLYRRPIDLLPGVEFHDAPRKIEFCSIDPDGRLAAVADGLGRVLLIDLSTKQVVRLWKGFRDATCHWLQQPQPLQSKRKKPSLYLVIHSRQRRVVEVWHARQGPRVSSVQVGRDAQILPCTSSSSRLASCYLIHSTVPGTTLNQVERIEVEHPQLAVESTVAPERTRSGGSVAAVASPTASRKGALLLQHLQQLLSADSTIHYTKTDVQKALHEIKSLADLSKALDLLAVGSVLEKKLRVKGSAFHKEALSYCHRVLTTAIHRRKSRTDATQANPVVQILTHKIDYHTQIVKAYDVLYRFEHSEPDAENQSSRTPTHWAAEAMAWASTYEQVTGTSLDADVSSKSRPPLLFSEFAASCAFPNMSGVKSRPPLKIYFSDSSRTRRDIFAHIFKPLLADVFSFNTVASIFENLGIRSDVKYTEKCFGEWFMTLSVREAYTKGLSSDLPPMVRLLQDLVTRQVASGLPETETPLGVLRKFCEESSDLVRAFMLGALCLEAVSRTVAQKEKSSFGKVQSGNLVSGWKATLRKLRVCLLVSLRMHGKRMAAPMTIDNVNQPGIFSVYEWLARDELMMSHDHAEILSLERACSMSSYSFDPSTPDGDGPSRFKMLQNSALSAAISEQERIEYLVDDDNRFGALLLFLKSHNQPKILAAHRALLLASEFGSNPEHIECLKYAAVALKSFQRTPGFEKLAAAVCLEIWHSRLCPIYRAHLFGFADVQELSEDVVSPLLQDREWLAAVGHSALQLLALLREYETEGPEDDSLKLSDVDVNTGWPPVRPDHVLRKILDKLPGIVDESALTAHSVVVCALLVSGDIKTLVQCIPDIYNFFVPQSLFSPVTETPDVQDLQRDYLNDAVFTLAREYDGPPLDDFDLGEVWTLASVWGFDSKSIRTVFLLSMYEYGKDRLVDELLTKATLQIDVYRFVDDGVDIACRRLNIFLGGSRMLSSGMRDIMGLLDAEMCEWIKQRSANSRSIVSSPIFDVAIGSTHLFIMRLLGLCAAGGVEEPLRAKIHSLVVFSGIMMKNLEDKS